MREKDDLPEVERWTWLRDGSIKRETETLILAAQKQSLGTNAIETKIDRSQDNSLCRLCKKSDETARHIVSGCSILAQKEYKRRHDMAVIGNNQCKILWHFEIQTKHVMKERRPDLVVVDEEKRMSDC